MKGIDISSYNGSVDFRKVKNSGIEAVIIKATEGVNYVDSKLEEYYTGASNAGLKVGFYHFMSEKTDPSAQAEDFWNSIKGKNFSIIPALDVEVNNLNRTASQITDRCLQFLNRFKNLSGYDCMIYTGAYFGRDSLDSRVKSHKGWIAHYGVSKPMETGFPVVGHQYSESGIVSGISGNCDLDNFTNGILIGSGSSSSSSGYSQKVADLQRIAGVTVDGIYGPQTDNAIKHLIAGIDYHTPELTKWIQSILGITADGIFGSTTESYVKRWQSAHGLTVDGIAGYNTIKSLALA